MTTAQELDVGPATPPPADVDHPAPEIYLASAPALTAEQRLEAIEAQLAELVAGINTISSAAGIIVNAVQREGLGGLLKALPALMASGR